MVQDSPIRPDRERACATWRCRLTSGPLIAQITSPRISSCQRTLGAAAMAPARSRSSDSGLACCAACAPQHTPWNSRGNRNRSRGAGPCPQSTTRVVCVCAASPRRHGARAASGAWPVRSLHPQAGGTMKSVKTGDKSSAFEKGRHTTGLRLPRRERRRHGHVGQLAAPARRRSPGAQPFGSQRDGRQLGTRCGLLDLSGLQLLRT